MDYLLEKVKERIKFYRPDFCFPKVKGNDEYGEYLLFLPEENEMSFKKAHYEIRIEDKDSQNNIVDEENNILETINVKKGDLYIQMHFEDENFQIKNEILRIVKAKNDELIMIDWRNNNPGIQLKEPKLTNKSNLEDIILNLNKFIEYTKDFNWDFNNLRGE